MSQNANHHQEERECIILQNHGQKIFCIFHKPAHLKKYPAVLLCHGLGGHKVGRYRVYVSLAKHLAELGIATLRIDFRGSGDSEGEFHDMTLEGEVSDALEGMKFLQEHKNVDPSRLAIVGRSLGSAVAVITASRFQKMKSMCLWAPVFDGHAWEEKWKKVHALDIHPSHKEELMTIEGQTPGYEFFKQFFNMKLEHEIQKLHPVPMLLIHGSQDTVVTIDHSEKYLKARLNADSETKYIQLPNSDHHFSNIADRQKALEETCKWLSSTLHN